MNFMVQCSLDFVALNIVETSMLLSWLLLTNVQNVNPMVFSLDIVYLDFVDTSVLFSIVYALVALVVPSVLFNRLSILQYLEVV